MAEPIEVPLADLVLHAEMQPRQRLDRPTVEKYRLALSGGADFPPIMFARVNGALVLVDGFHRVAAMRLLNRTTVLGEDLGELRWEEAIWAACRANVAHGLPLRRAELREVFRAYVRAGRHKVPKGRATRLRSYREIAKELGGVVSYSAVRTWMKQDFPAVFRSLSGQALGKETSGGLRARNASVIMAREVRSGLDHAMASLPGVTDPQARSRLRELVQCLLDALDSGPLEEPDF